MLICPRCKSNKIVLANGGITGKYRCKNCGYIGNFIIEKILKRKSLKKK